MEKTLQILAVFALLMLVVTRFLRGREEKFRRFGFLGRVKGEAPGDGVALAGDGGALAGSEDALAKGEIVLPGGKVALPSVGEGGLIEGVFGESEGRERIGVPENVDAFVFDEGSRLLFCYTMEGRLTIYRRLAGGAKRELQELSVPLDCSAMVLDTQERKLYLEEQGEWFVYGEEGE